MILCLTSLKLERKYIIYREFWKKTGIKCGFYKDLTLK